MLLAVIGFGIVVSCFGYILVYDLMQAVFSINATLKRLALDVAEIKAQRRGEG